MIRIIDFDDGCGGLTSGMEAFGEFEVIYNGTLSSKNEFCYNNTHIHDFWTGFSFDYSFMKDVDARLATFALDFGGSISHRGAQKFDLHYLDDKFDWIKKYQPEVVLLQTPIHALHLLNDNQINQTSDGWPIADYIVNFLKSDACGYKNVCQFAVEYPNFSIPQDKTVNFYVAWRNDKEFLAPISDGKKRASSMMSVLNNVQNTTWHNPNFKKEHICAQIKQGGCASKTPDVDVSYGYVRLVKDKIAPTLSNEFYRVTSRSPTIHPVENRPLTIREGARLHGLDDKFDWDKSMSKKEVARMIHSSTSPIIGYHIAKSIFSLMA